MEIAQIEPMLPYVDCFQVGARNMQNFNLLRELGQVRKPVLLKRGIAATIEELLLSSEYILSGGNYEVILCERGIRTYETATRNTMDISAIPVLRKLTHLPVVADPSHGTGRRDMVAPMAKAAVAAGADALLVEIHPNADKAVSDAAQTLYLDQFEKLAGECGQSPRPSGERCKIRQVSAYLQSGWLAGLLTMIERIAILGTGLLGTSVGLALRAAGYKGSIVGLEPQPRTCPACSFNGRDRLRRQRPSAGRACEPGDRARTTHLRDARLYGEALWPSRLGAYGHGRGKHQAAHRRSRARASTTRPSARHFLPGHPMAGKERGGAALGDANLFRGAVWLFTDDPEAQRSAHSAELVKDWREWVAAMGAKTLDLDPVRHDELVAWVSHLPQFMATALSALLEDEVGDAPELKDVGGRALREMTRLGASPYSMWRDIAYTNTEAVEHALLALEQRLAHLRENLRTAELRNEFEQANRFRKE